MHNASRVNAENIRVFIRSFNGDRLCYQFTNKNYSTLIYLYRKLRTNQDLNIPSHLTRYSKQRLAKLLWSFASLSIQDLKLKN